MSHEHIFLRYQPIAKQIARGFMRKLPRSVLIEDIESAAMMGLWDAVTRGVDHGAFEWYARTRIRGAILDELRTQDWLPRRARARNPELSIFSLDAFENIDSVGEFSVDAEAEQALDRKQRSQVLADRMARLLPRDRAIVEEVLDGKTQWEIAQDLGLSEPRISQLRSRAVACLLGRRRVPVSKSGKPPLPPRAKQARKTQQLWPALVDGSWLFVSGSAFSFELRKAHHPHPLPLRDASVLKHWLLNGVSKDTASRFHMSRSLVSEILHTSLKTLGFTCFPNAVPALLALAARANDSELDCLSVHVREDGSGAVGITPDASWLSILSAVESELVHALLDGETREVLAARRGTSPRTIANQLTSAFSKLNVSTVAELRALCARVHVKKAATQQRAA